MRAGGVTTADAQLGGPGRDDHGRGHRRPRRPAAGDARSSLSSPDGDALLDRARVRHGHQLGAERPLHGVRPGRDVLAAGLRRGPADGGADRRGAGGCRDPRADRAPGAAGAARARRRISRPGICAGSNAERAADGLPAGLTLAPRWSAECAAHDDYERVNGVLTSTENPESPGASVGGAWAGLNSDLAEGRWTPHGQPVGERADPPARAAGAQPVRSSGSTTATAISASPPIRGSCVRPPTTDRISTYPADGANTGRAVRARARVAVRSRAVRRDPERPHRGSRAVRLSQPRPPDRAGAGSGAVGQARDPRVIRWRCAGSTPRRRPSVATCRARS